VLGQRHPDYLYIKNTRGYLYYMRQRFPEAADIFRSVVETGQLVFPADHAWLLLWKDNLGWAQIGMGQYEEAEKTLRPIIEPSLRILGEDHRETLRTTLGLAGSLIGQRRFDEAETLAMQVYRITSTKGPRWLNEICLLQLVRLYTDWGKPEQASLYKSQLPD